MKRNGLTNFNFMNLTFKKLTMEAIIKIYLDYYNNFLSINRFADHYDIEPAEAETLINLGRKYHERICSANKLIKYMEQKRNGTINKLNLKL